MDISLSSLLAQVTEGTNQNSVVRDTALGSKWFDPGYLFNQAAAFFNGLFNFTNSNGTDITSIFHTALFFFAIFFLTIISYCTVRMFEIRAKESKHLEHEIAEYAHREKERQKRLREIDAVSKNERWIKTLAYLFSQHASDWKLAVIEADSMLEELMNQLGFRGATLGDKLKSSTQETFKGLSGAWEVHNIRNRIAHEGALFELNQREAKRVIALYEQIFREYGFI